MILEMNDKNVMNLNYSDLFIIKSSLAEFNIGTYTTLNYKNRLMTGKFVEDDFCEIHI